MRFSSMRGRMTAAFALVLTVLMAIVCGGLIWYARFAEERNADSMLRMGANKIIQERDDENSTRNTALFVAQQSEELGKDGLLLRAPALPSGVKNGAELRSFPVPVRTVAVPINGTIVLLGLPWQRTEARLRAQAGALVALALFGVAIGTAGAWFLVGRTLSPIAALSTEADSAHVDLLRVRLNAPSSDAEIVHLVATLNRMLQRLSQSASAQSRFYAAASHEMRTPLHTLSGHLELGLSRERSNSEYRTAMNEAYRQTMRLNSLVHDLFLLTRLNSAPCTQPTDPIDLVALCERTVHQFSEQLAKRHIHLQCSLTAQARILAVPSHAEMLVRNLLENVANYTPHGGEAVVTIRRDRRAVGETVVLDIFNNCAPLNVPDARQLLEPFYRPDASRHSETGGAGLGLAICDAIVRCSAWDLHLREVPSGFQVTVVFPAAPRKQ